MISQKIMQKIANASSIADLMNNGVLPEPNDDGSYFFFYYSRKDFKPALKDIVALSTLGQRIWYDRKQETGMSWEMDMLSKASDFHCAAVVFYLSENAVRSKFFWQLCALVSERHVAYCSVNLPNEKGNILSWQELERRHDFTPEQKLLAEQLFGEEITYIPYSLTVEEKKIALDRIGKDNLLIYTIEKGTATVLGVKDLAEEEIVIPEFATVSEVEYPVRRIAPRAFANCSRLKKIIIPDSVECVGEFLDDIGEVSNVGQAFVGCFALEEIKMPAGLKVIRMNNFESCPSLKRVYIGDNVEKIIEYDNVFDELEELRLPPLVKRTQDGKLLYFDGTWKFLAIYCEGNIYGCDEIVLEEKFVPEKGSVIGDLYRESTLLREVDARNLDTENFDGHFWYCTNLEKVILPQSTKTIGYTFSGCTALPGVELPQSLEEIGPYTFSECNFEELVIPQNVHTIESEAFKDATIHSLVSDSKYNDKLFAKNNRFSEIADQLKQSGKKLPKLFIVLMLWFKLFFVLLGALFKGNIITLFLILTYPVSYWFIVFGGGTKVTDDGNIERLYLRKGTHKKKLRGWRQIPSDRDDYDLFIEK